MPNWRDVLDEIRATGSGYDVVRRKYLAALHEVTGRNVITYYSGWLQKSDLIAQIPSVVSLFSINDEDKNGFMSAIHKMDRSKGLDLILHTPGGDAAATESLVDYLRSMFDSNVRAIVPQLAMSGGTLIALASREIVMGKHSSLGPIDPQMGGIAAHGVVEEFRRAYDEIRRDNVKVAIWQPIISKYHPTMVGECEKALAWSTEMAREWLKTGMFADISEEERASKIDNVLKELGDHAYNKSHNRHISASRALEMGLSVKLLEDDDALQEAVLSLHHACIQTLSATPAIKMIENQHGAAFIKQVNISTGPA